MTHEIYIRESQTKKKDFQWSNLFLNTTRNAVRPAIDCFGLNSDIMYSLNIFIFGG